MNIFEQAARDAFRFTCPTGNVTTEDLWKMSKPELSRMYADYDNQLTILPSGGLEEVDASQQVKDDLKLKMDIIKYIYDDKVEAEVRALEAKRAREHNAEIDRLIASKEQDALKDMSVEELQAMRKS